jgi:TonB family protein
LTNYRLASRLFMIAAWMALGTYAHAQATPPPFDVAVSSLAARIAEPLEKSNAKKVVVAEFHGPDGEVHPVGKYLADRLSESLQKEFPALEMIARPQQEANAHNKGDSGDDARELEKSKAWARNLGADFVITGSFAKLSEGIAVFLAAASCKKSSKSLGAANGLVPITSDITTLSADPIPSPKNGIFRAGMFGTTVPSCVQCPTPDYTDQARAAGFEGVVVLDIVVNIDGQAEQIVVVNGPGLGLDENAINAVKKWKFKPALGPSGNPVPVRVKIEVAFRIFRRN